MSNYNKLYTPAGSAIAFIDHQPQMTFGVASIDRATQGRGWHRFCKGTNPASDVQITMNN